MLLDHQADPNVQTNDGDTPLHHAAFRGDRRMMALLLKKGASPNIANFK
jgi:ankyrin repeat protein